jgi:hypothetical protein
MLYQLSYVRLTPPTIPPARIGQWLIGGMAG